MKWLRGWSGAPATAILLGTVAVVALAVVAGCAIPASVRSGITASSPADRKEAALRKRVEARWAALINDDVPASYAVLSPASKAMLTEQQYQGRIRRSGYRSMDIDTIACLAETCKVKLFITFDVRQMKGLRSPITETWVMDGGEYWYVWPM